MFLKVNPCEKKEEEINCTEGRAEIQYCLDKSSVKSVVGGLGRILF